MCILALPFDVADANIVIVVVDVDVDALDALVVDVVRRVVELSNFGGNIKTTVSVN